MQSFDAVEVAGVAAAAPTSSTSTSSFLARLFSPRRGATRFQRLAVEEDDGDSRRNAGSSSNSGSFFENDNEPGTDDDDDDDSENGDSPEDSASPLSMLLFSFATPLVALGSLKPLERGDLWPLSRRDRASKVARDFAARLRASSSSSSSTSSSMTSPPSTTAKKKPSHHPRGSVAAAAVSAHGRAFAAAGAIKLLHDVVMFLPPYLLERLLKHKADANSGSENPDSNSSSSSSPRRNALLLALALAAAGAAEPLIINQYFHRLFRIQLHLKAQLVDCLFARALRCSVAARDRRSTGAVANLMSNDASKLFSLPQYLHMIWSAPFQILVVMAMLVRVLGLLPAAVGLAVTASLVPFSTFVGRELGKLRKATVSATDERLKLTSEVLGGIKAVKIYGWEAAYAERIETLREEELRRARKGALVGVANTMMYTGAPILISLAAFSVFALSGKKLTADVAFPALALFQLLRFPVTMLPSQVTALIQGKVALDRIQGFLEDEEVQGRARNGEASSLPLGSIEVCNAAFAWSRVPNAPNAQEVPRTPPLVTLSVSSLRIAPGSLVVVVGPVGSGKSSLLAALLGEMHALPLEEGEENEEEKERKNSGGSGADGDGNSGDSGNGNGETSSSASMLVSVRGSVAFCSQEPWIQNATVRENVRAVNGHAPLLEAVRSAVPVAEVLGVRAFDPRRILEAEPDFLKVGDPLADAPDHVHDQTVTSVGIEEEGSADEGRLNAWLSRLLEEKGADLFRSKGILSIRGSDARFVFQGVHMLLQLGSSGETEGAGGWRPGERRVNRLVFIGRNLDRAALTASFRACLVSA